MTRLRRRSPPAHLSRDSCASVTCDSGVNLAPCSGMVFPSFRPWVESYIGLDVNDPSPGTSHFTPQRIEAL